jgi:hypothetical protein
VIGGETGKRDEAKMEMRPAVLEEALKGRNQKRGER